MDLNARERGEASALASARRLLEAAATKDAAAATNARAGAAANVGKVAESTPAGQKVSIKDVRAMTKAEAKAAEAAKRAARPQLDG